jgi:UDP-N-acetylmuramate--alanine ligase
VGVKIHFIGIGGIGVSALAQYYLARGNYKVSGSDLASSEITKMLKEKGAKVMTGRHRAENMPDDAGLVIYSPAVLPSNPELKKAKKLGIAVMSYPEALGEITKRYFTIAVSGAHGKSTTASMLAQILIKAGLEPTVIVGTKLKEFGDSNFRAGKGKYLVIEADEWQASFLNYWPKVIVLTNIEREHLDYYKNLDNILKTFKEYISHLPKKGVLVANGDDENISKILPPVETYKIEKYSLKQKEASRIRKIMKVPGSHNASNAIASLVVARFLNIPDEVSLAALSEFEGTWRRFEIKKGKIGNKNFTIVSDYGHHPT